MSHTSSCTFSRLPSRCFVVARGSCQDSALDVLGGRGPPGGPERRGRQDQGRERRVPVRRQVRADRRQQLVTSRRARVLEPPGEVSQRQQQIRRGQAGARRAGRKHLPAEQDA